MSGILADVTTGGDMQAVARASGDGGRRIGTGRRAFAGILAGLAAWVIAPAVAQSPSGIRRLGFITLRSDLATFDRAFVQGLRDLGYVEGRDLVIDYRFGHNDLPRLERLAGELVASKPDVILAAGPAIGAVARRTRTLPIVMAAVSDPVGQGYAASLRVPGGNLTGVTMQSTQLAQKRIQLLRDIVPGVKRIALLAFRAGTGTDAHFVLVPELEVAARSLGIGLVARLVAAPGDLRAAFAQLRGEGAQAVIVQANPLSHEHRQAIFALATEHRLPALYEFRLYVDDVGLLSYGPDLDDVYRRAAPYVDKILRGAKPGDLAIDQPGKFELVVNLKAARALGVAIPQPVLLRADDVIR